MYLLERITGISVYVLLLLIFCFLLSKDNKKVGKILKIYAILLTVLAFFYVPSKEADLYRHFEAVRRYASYSISGLIESMASTTTPIVVLMYFITAKIGIYGILPALGAFVFYNNIFYILRKSYEKYDVKPIVRSLVLFFVMALGTYIEAISGIRTMLSFSIILRCVYDEIYENKSIVKNALWYIIASSIHLVSFAMVVLRLIVYAFSMKRNRWLNFVVVLCALSAIVVLGTDVIQKAWEVGIYYATNQSYQYIWEYILMAIAVCYLVYVKYRCKKQNIIDENLNKISVISNVLLIIMIVLFNRYTIFHRFGTFNILLNIPLITKYISEGKDNKKQYTILFVGMIMMALACVRGNLCGFKFFEL